MTGADDVEAYLWSEGPASGAARTSVGLEYYHGPFHLLHDELQREGTREAGPHLVRAGFWQLIPHAELPPTQAQQVLESYLTSIEQRLQKTIGKCSLAYWLHLLRRIAPYPIGRDRKASTVGLTRAALEAAIQKYAQLQPCSRVGFSDAVPMDEVLGGLLMHEAFSRERSLLTQHPQLVLTHFTSQELREFYDLERLAYEAWRATAMMRSTGKGASLVLVDPPECVEEVRSEELEKLLEIYDRRVEQGGMLHVSAKGCLFDEGALETTETGYVFLANYNVKHATSQDFEAFFHRAFGFKFATPLDFNFVWLPFDLRSYRAAHLPFADAFEKRHGVPLDGVLAVIGALCQRVFHSWRETQGHSLGRYWQRAYEGPYARQYVLDEIRAFLPYSVDLLGLRQNSIPDDEVTACAGFLELTGAKRQHIDVRYPDPHYILLPYSDERVFIDYAWIGRRLFDLLFRVSILDQNFKSEAMERLVQSERLALPTKPCLAFDGTRKQIDAAYASGERLVIAECKAVEQSRGFHRGQPQAIRYRIENVVEKGLNETDEKAAWLAARPRGTNYDISSYTEIVPVVVSPFVEFIPSLEERYWLAGDLPRVMTPRELKSALEDGTLSEVTANVLSVSR